MLEGIQTQKNSSHTNLAGSDTDSSQCQCAEKGLPSSGRRNVLISRLQQHAATPSSTIAAADLPSTSTSPESDDPPPPLLTEQHLAQTQSIVTQSVEQSVATIATKAAHAAVEAMSLMPPTNNANRSPVVVDEIAVSTRDLSPISALSITLQSTWRHTSKEFKRVSFFICLSYCLRTHPRITCQRMP